MINKYNLNVYDLHIKGLLKIGMVFTAKGVFFELIDYSNDWVEFSILDSENEYNCGGHIPAETRKDMTLLKSVDML